MWEKNVFLFSRFSFIRSVSQSFIYWWQRKERASPSERKFSIWSCAIFDCVTIVWHGWNLFDFDYWIGLSVRPSVGWLSRLHFIQSFIHLYVRRNSCVCPRFCVLFPRSAKGFVVFNMFVSARKCLLHLLCLQQHLRHFLGMLLDFVHCLALLDIQLVFICDQQHQQQRKKETQI